MDEGEMIAPTLSQLERHAAAATRAARTTETPRRYRERRDVARAMLAEIRRAKRREDANGKHE